MTDVKTRCDDCKFVENCVDYGWQGCKKFTPKPSEPMTEQEYLQTCNTEQLAEAILQQWIHGAYHGVGEFGLTDKEIELSREDIVEWLKQPHSEVGK